MSQPGVMDVSVKKRAELALNDDFLRKAVKFTTERLRNGKKSASEEHGNWDEWRERGRQIRLHTIAHLDYYLNEFVNNARANGVHIHFADTSAEAAAIALDIAAHNEAASVVKSKSMVSEEVHLNHALESAGIEAIETDLGEYIIQLAGKPLTYRYSGNSQKSLSDCGFIIKRSRETLEPDTTVLAGFVRKSCAKNFSRLISA